MAVEACRDKSFLERNGNDTNTTIEQNQVERDVMEIYSLLRDNSDVVGEGVSLLRDKHLQYLRKGIRHLSANFEVLDASQPWLCYWTLHSMALLGEDIPDEVAKDVVTFLSKCQSPTGGFGGGPGQLPHLAPTYAAVLTLCTIGTDEAFSIIDRPNLQKFLLSLHQKDGSFIMHEDGEVDIRGTYCAIVAAILTNILCPDLITNTIEWVESCQTYEGGFSAVPGTEAHGGYTFCGFATLSLLEKTKHFNMRALLRWITRKQMKTEGGFQGRTNKLVDGCYSFWQGGVFPLIYLALKQQGDEALDPELWQFDQEALQEYILYCCQNTHGGLIDKPGKSRDLYHTCYCLSGLSIAQHCYGNKNIVNISLDSDSVLQPTHPAFNIVADKVQSAYQYFSKLMSPNLLHRPDETDSTQDRDS